VLWAIERKRALAILKRSVSSLQRILEEKTEST